MREEEAKAKWCPFVRAGSGQSGLGAMNRDAFPGDHARDLVEHHTRCIASACMAWRWDREQRQERGRPYIEAIKDHRARHDSSLVEAKRAVDATWTAPSLTQGFCGLAGQP